jgi:predicted nuclease of predicted toxin-antitoxin system
VRFCLDEDLSDEVARIARAHGLDVISSHECGRDGLSDDAQLRLAADEGRCVVTRNRDDFVHWTVRFFENGWPHAGVLIVARSLPNGNSAAIAAALITYAQRYEGDLPSYTVDLLTSTS